jgi:hypothetical protein
MALNEVTSKDVPKMIPTATLHNPGLGRYLIGPQILTHRCAAYGITV